MSSTDNQKQEISSIIEVIIEQTETILSFEEGQIPQIELDLVCENIRKLYTNYNILNKLNSKLVERLTDAIADDVLSKQVSNTSAKLDVEVTENELNKESTSVEENKIEVVSAPNEESPETKEEYNAPTITPIPAAEPLPSLSIKVEEPVVELMKEAPVQDAQEQIAKQIITPSKPPSEPKSKTNKSHSSHQNEAMSVGNLFAETSTSLADQFKNDKKSVYEQIGKASEEHSIAEKLQQKPISDLVKSIGINDRFLLIKELFNNNGDEYNEAIQLLNNFSTIVQAFDYLDVLRQKFDWNENANASLKLYDLVRRKYQQ